MTRHVGATIKGHGISNTLRAKKFERATRINPKERQDQRKTAGYIVDQFDEGTVHLYHYLGNKHGITRAADRAKVVNGFLDQYVEALDGRFAITRVGDGEDAHLVIRERPNPIVSDTLRQAAEHMFKMGNDVAAAAMKRWADLADEGQDW